MSLIKLGIESRIALKCLYQNKVSTMRESFLWTFEDIAWVLERHGLARITRNRNVSKMACIEITPKGELLAEFIKAEMQ